MNKRPRYIDGFPAALIQAGTARAQGLYQTASTIDQDLSDLRTLIQNIQDSYTVLDQRLTDTTSSLQSNITVATTGGGVDNHINLIGNGDFSQNSFSNGFVAWSKRDTPTQPEIPHGFIAQQRALPMIDRWYHVAEINTLAAKNFKAQATQVSVTPTTTGPQTATTALNVRWTATTTGTALKLPLTNTSYWHGIVGIQQRIPDVTRFQTGTISIAFWSKATHVKSFAVVLKRQYSATSSFPGGPTGTNLAKAWIQPNMEYIGSYTFQSSLDWTQQSCKFVLPTFNNSLTIDPLRNGLVIQICPLYYASYMRDDGTVDTFKLCGDDMCTGASMDIDLTLTEVQVQQTDLSLQGQPFPQRADEGSFTRPYIQTIQLAPDPYNTSSKIGWGYGRTTKIGTNLDNDGKNWIANKFILNFPDTFVRKPTNIVISAYNTDNNAYRIGAYMTSGRGGEHGDVTYADGTMQGFCAEGKSACVCMTSTPDFTNLSVRQTQLTQYISLPTQIVSESIGIGNTNTAASGTVTFPKSFASGVVPRVIVMPEVDTSGVLKMYAVNISSVSNTGFNYRRIYYDPNYNTLNDSVAPAFHYVAIADNDYETTYHASDPGTTKSHSSIMGDESIMSQPTTVHTTGFPHVESVESEVVYTGNNKTGGSGGWDGSSGIRRITFDIRETNKTQANLIFYTSTLTNPKDSTKGNQVGYIQPLESALESDPTHPTMIAVLVNEFDTGALNNNDLDYLDQTRQAFTSITIHPTPT